MSFARLLYLAGVGAVLAGALRLWVVEGIYIASPSMAPTLRVGAHLFLDKWTYRFREPRRGDIVAFSAPVPPHEEMVKRIVALPGDTVELRAKKLHVNGAAVEEPYVRHARAGERLQGDDLGPLEVPPRHYFVLGDNRDESNDSSVWKDEGGEPSPFVPRSRVRGIVRGVY